MAFPQKIRNGARRLWVQGYSCDKIIKLLAAQFPNEKTPAQRRSIEQWRDAEDWYADKAIIEQKVREKYTQDVVDELSREEIRDIETLNAVLEHVRGNLAVDADGHTRLIDPVDLARLAQAADRAMRRKRINRYGFDTIKKLDFEKVSSDALQEFVEVST